MNVDAVFNNTIFDPMWNDFPVSSEKEKSQIAKLRSILANFQKTTMMSKLLQISSVGTETLTAGANPADIVNSMNPSQTASNTSTLCNAIAVRINTEMQAVQNGQSMYDFVEIYSSSHVENYQTVYRSICIEMIKSYMKNDMSNIESISQNITNHLLNNITAVEPGMSDVAVDQMLDFDQYMVQVSNTVYNYVATTKPTQIAYITRGYLSSHLPFLVYTYILSFIKTSSDAENKPDTFVVHQFAILAAKAFMIQSLLVLYDGADDQHKALLKPRILSFLNSIMLEYKNQNFTTYYTKINELIHMNTVDQEDISRMNENIVKSRANLNKAAVNVTGTKDAVKMSVVRMYIWMSMLIFLGVSVVALVLLIKQMPEKSDILLNVLYSICGILVVGVSINIFVNTLRAT